MAIGRDEGLVVKTQKLGETSKIVTLFSPGVGRLKLVAKGARGRKSKFGGLLEIPNRLSVVYYHKPTRELRLLSQADLIEDYNGLRADIEKSMLAAVICEHCYKIELGPSERRLLYGMTNSMLSALAITDAHPENYLWAFQLRFLQIFGVAPDFTRCARCGRDTENGTAEVDIANGHLACGKCAGGGGVSLTAECLRVIHALSHSPVQSVGSVSLSWQARHQLESFLEKHTRYHIEGFANLRSLRVYHQLENSLLRASARTQTEQ